MTKRLVIEVVAVLVLAAGSGTTYAVTDLQARLDEAVQASVQDTEASHAALARGDGATAGRETVLGRERSDAAEDLRVQRDFVWTAVGVFLAAALVIVGIVVARRPRRAPETTAPIPVAATGPLSPPVRRSAPGRSPAVPGVAPRDPRVRWAPPVRAPYARR